MDSRVVVQLVVDLLLVLAAGVASGIVCKRLGISLLVGYLLAGGVFGAGGLGWLARQSHELRHLADVGALMLLFSIGIEFSLEELVRMSRSFLLGGAVQMTLVAIPVALACGLCGMSWQAAALLGAAAALSSTVLVYKALQEWGQGSSPHGRRAVGILLFQDVATVPLMLVVPLLTGGPEDADAPTWQMLLLDAALFLVAVPLARSAVARWIAPLLASLRSTELVVLFTVTVLGGASLGAYTLGLPPALGALAAGLILNGNRLSGQIDAVVLPYRETFAAVFFVSLGTLMQFDAVWSAPLVSLLGLAGMLLAKTIAAALALRLVGLGWKASLGMGLGLSQLGELSFLLLSEGLRQQVLTPVQYDRMLVIALGTLILTPQLIKTGLRWTGETPAPESESTGIFGPGAGDIGRAIVIGLGPIGGQVTSRLEMLGMDVCLIDLSPVNLHPFAQQGFRTVAGDASDPDLLRRAGAGQCRLVVVTVPDDRTALQIVATLRNLNAHVMIVVRCRYQANVARVRRAGASAVVSEEAEASGALLRLLEPAKQLAEMRMKPEG